MHQSNEYGVSPGHRASRTARSQGTTSPPCGRTPASGAPQGPGTANNNRTINTRGTATNNNRTIDASQVLQKTPTQNHQQNRSGQAKSSSLTI